MNGLLVAATPLTWIDLQVAIILTTRSIDGREEVRPRVPNITHRVQPISIMDVRQVAAFVLICRCISRVLGGIFLLQILHTVLLRITLSFYLEIWLDQVLLSIILLLNNTFVDGGAIPNDIKGSHLGAQIGHFVADLLLCG